MELKNLAHVDSQTLTMILDTIQFRKWKKLARNISKTDTETQSSIAAKRGREDEDEIQLMLPCKKNLVSRVDGHDTLMAEAVQQPRQSP